MNDASIELVGELIDDEEEEEDEITEDTLKPKPEVKYKSFKIIKSVESSLPNKRQRKASKKKLESMEMFICAKCPLTFSKVSQLKAHSKQHEESVSITKVCIY